MTETPDLRKIYHDLASKCAALKSAVQVLRDSPPEEKKEMLALMTEAATAILKCLSELQKGSGLDS
ncbi:MAG TPA: hypothetical protein DCL44_11105, partial [Elusimicrobia bacterium]|nr:hypothetical protein [Elusimicrobiota bacterium]